MSLVPEIIPMEGACQLCATKGSYSVMMRAPWDIETWLVFCNRCSEALYERFGDFEG